MPKIKLTDRTLQAIKPPGTGQVDYFDEGLPGFGVRVGKGGRKSFFAMYRAQGRQRRFTLGTYPSLSLKEARGRARDAQREAAHGQDPAARKVEERRELRFSELADRYLEEHAKRKKRSWPEDDRILRHDLRPRFGRLVASAVERSAVRRLLNEIAIDRGAPVMANRTLALLRKIYNFGIKADLVVCTNPCLGVDRPGLEVERDRVLSDEEIRAFWNATATLCEPYTLIFRLLLLTLQRHDEVLGMEKAELDLEEGWWNLRAERAKSKSQNRIPLSAPAVQLLRSALTQAGKSQLIDDNYFLLPTTTILAGPAPG